MLPQINSIGRILLVEDSPLDAELILQALAESKLAKDVMHVRDGAEALDYLYRRNRYAFRTGGQPPFVLLDLKMPKVDGFEVLRRIKEDPQLKTIPVVVFTSSREEQDLVRSYEMGANSFFVKPVDFQQFVELVGKAGRMWAFLNEPPPASRGESHIPSKTPL